LASADRDNLTLFGGTRVVPTGTLRMRRRVENARGTGRGQCGACVGGRSLGATPRACQFSPLNSLGGHMAASGPNPLRPTTCKRQAVSLSAAICVMARPTGQPRGREFHKQGNRSGGGPAAGGLTFFVLCRRLWFGQQRANAQGGKRGLRSHPTAWLTTSPTR